MDKRIVFRPSLVNAGTGQNVQVFESTDITPSGWLLIGYVPIGLALKLHPVWQWMTDAEFSAKAKEWTKGAAA